MKIAVASNNHVNVSGHLGRCKEFVVFETNNEKNIVSKEIRQNTFNHHSHFGDEHQHWHEGIHAHNHNELIGIINDCSHIIFQSGGWRVIEDLKANNITPLLTDEADAEKAVKKFLAGELISNEDNTCNHH